MNKLHRSVKSTAFIELDTRKCIACFRCVESCPKKVFGRVKILWHKHAVICHADRCIGCFKCVRECQPAAITKRIMSENEN